MTLKLLAIALAPVLIIAIYIYLRDRYEREPLKILLKALLTGMFIVIPILLVETVLDGLFFHEHPAVNALWDAFAVAAITEESFKFMAFMLLFYRSRDFNEIFDGIVYAVFISLGFAAVENVLYIFSGGINTGMVRAFTAVPAHAVFGVIMGYNLGFFKFAHRKRLHYAFLALVSPIIWHGLYDYLIMSGYSFLLILFVPLVVIIWITGIRKVTRLSSSSVPIPPGDCE